MMRDGIEETTALTAQSTDALRREIAAYEALAKIVLASGDRELQASFLEYIIASRDQDRLELTLVSITESQMQLLEAVLAEIKSASDC